MSEPFTGGKGLARSVDEGKDPNADLDTVEPGETETRAQAAVALKIWGASYTDIAKQLGYSSAYRARTVVERTIAKGADNPDDISIQRVLADRRLSRLLTSVMGKATDPKDPQHLAYNARALAIQDRIIRLYGMDAPTQTVVHTPDTERVMAWVQSMVTLAGRDVDAGEAEIVDADVVEDDG